MNSFTLVLPLKEHEKQYLEMMDEWEVYGGKINPGALRRYSNPQKKTVSYNEWLNWIDDDRKAGRYLYFFIKYNRIFGAISVRTKEKSRNLMIDGHCGFGIRPSERMKGYASKMLQMALLIIKDHGINPVIITCNKDNIGSAKTILNNRGVFIEEIIEEEKDNIIQRYKISI